MQVWLDGALESADAARISVLDGGLTVGTGVFETMKVVDGVPFALTRHLQRLARSAAALDIAVPSDEVLAGALAAVIDANAAEVGELGRLRLTLTSGAAKLGDPYSVTGSPTMLVTVVAARPWAPTARVIDSSFTRNEHGALAGVKSTSYAENAIALREAHAMGADEALLCNSRGELCEGTGSNVFLVIDDHIVTPPLSSGCLNGVTRQLVIEWCGAREVVVDGALLASASAAFLTSSTRDIHPIGQWGGRRFGTPGAVVAAAQDIWRQRSQELDP